MTPWSSPAVSRARATSSRSPMFMAEIRNFHDSGRLVAAICVGPTVLASAGIWQVKMQPSILAWKTPGRGGSRHGPGGCHRWKCHITSRGMGTAIPLWPCHHRHLSSAEDAKTMAKKIVFRPHKSRVTKVYFYVIIRHCRCGLLQMLPMA